MRICRLDLLAYGHFTDAGFDLPQNQPDIHFVYGLNEAGKSTALCAIEDLLFGIPQNTRLGFLHDHGSMRLGAIIERKGNTLGFRRRRGRKDTILNRDGEPLPEGEAALAPFLEDVERAFYARMFCLDHERLRQGGREILEAQDDVGQILFSAGAGIAGLREHLRKLHADADALWGNRRASHRKFFLIEDKLKLAEKAVRERSVMASQWHELRMTLDKANEACKALEIEVEMKAAEVRKLNRIRRICRDVQQQAELTGRIEELGRVVSLRKDASLLLQHALNSDAQAQTRLATLNEQIEALRAERNNLTYDERLLARGDDIRLLNERRIQIRGMTSDLPKRRAELAATELDLKRLAAELDWTIESGSEIVAHIPARPNLANARGLSKRRGELIKAEENAHAASAEADERVSTLTQKISEDGQPIGIPGLAAAISVAREAGDITARITLSEKESRNATDAVQTLLRTMRPTVSGAADLVSLHAPQKDTVEFHRDRSRELMLRLQACRDQIRNVELVLERHRKEHERIAITERVVPAEELQRLRQHRDAGWKIIRLKYMEEVIVSDDDLKAFEAGGCLPDAFEVAIRVADDAADQRFDRVQVTARLAEISRQMAEQLAHLEELRGQERGYCNDVATLSDEWLTLWSEFPLTLLAPDFMLGWMDARAQVLQALEKKANAEQEIVALRDEEARMRVLLTNELAVSGIETDSLTARPLRVVLEMAANTHRQHEAKAENRRRLEEELKKATADAARKRRELERARVSFTEWKDKWSAAVRLLGLNSETAAEILDAQIDTLDEMREVANRMNDLKGERIEKIERDIGVFNDEVASVISSIAPQLIELASDDAALELERLMKEATRAQERAVALDIKIAAEQKKADACDQERRDSNNTIESLQQAAGVSSVGELQNAIRRSDELRSVEVNLGMIMVRLTQDGDGLSVADLTAECAGSDLDQIVAHEQTLNQELTDLRTRQMEASEARSAARRQFEAVGGDDGAARAAADKQSALADMKETAEEYVRLRSSELVLQWAVDRYRREKQAPLLRRASELFAVLSGGSFKDLRLEFDEQDNAQLAGIRQDGRKVTVLGMSAGSTDQLYLALRVAAIEDFLSHSAPLPFIADDLFINFDDERAAAGFKVLAQLARKTQVLFFTHHQHLLDVARAAIGSGVSAISLSDAMMPLDSAVA